MNVVQLVMEVGCLRTDHSGAGIRHHLSLLDQAHAVLLADVDRFDRSLEWAIAGYPSLVAWLAENHRCTRGEAKRMVATDINNMGLLCSHHHKQVHRPGWTARMHPATHQLEIVTPTGRVLTQPSAADALSLIAGKPITRPKTTPRTTPHHGHWRPIGNGIYKHIDRAADE